MRDATLTVRSDSQQLGRSAADAPFVWLVWLAMFAAALYFVWTYGRNIPRGDEQDDDFRPVLVGEASPTPAWFWQQHYEHRMPLAKLIMLVLYRTTGDLRSGMVFNACALAVAAAALILAARRARGWTAPADAVFPLFLLNWGHADNLTWFFEVQFVTCGVLAAIALACLAGGGGRPTRWAIAGFGVCLPGLVGCGACGLAMLPPLALWLLAYGLSSPTHRWAAALAAIPALALGACYLVDFHPPKDEMLPTLGVLLEMTNQVLSSSLALTLNYSYWLRWGVLALALLALGVCQAFYAWVKQPAERWRTAGLLCFLAAIVSIALAIAIGRGRYGIDSGMGLSPRYVTLVAPLPCAVYLIVVLYQRGKVGHWMQIAFLGLALLTTWLNLDPGRFWAASRTDLPVEKRMSMRGESRGGTGSANGARWIAKAKTFG